MTTLLRVDASIRVEGSVTRALADSAQAAWQAAHPDGTVVRRDLGRNPIPAETWPHVVGTSMGWLPGEEVGPEHQVALDLAHELLEEFKSADAYLLAVPLYNYGISQHFKTWIDVLLTERELLTPPAPVAGRPVVFTLARGGGYGPGTPKEGWDHATAYLERIFGDVLGMDLRIAAAELTLAPFTPGMESLVDAAKESEQAAHVTADEHGAEVGRLLFDRTAA